MINIKLFHNSKDLLTDTTVSIYIEIHGFIFYFILSKTVPVVPASPPPAYDNHDFDKPYFSCEEMCAEVNETQGAVGGKE